MLHTEKVFMLDFAFDTSSIKCLIPYHTIHSLAYHRYVYVDPAQVPTYYFAVFIDRKKPLHSAIRQIP